MQAAYDALCAEHARLRQLDRFEAAEAAEAAAALRTETQAATERKEAAEVQAAAAEAALAAAAAAQAAREAELQAGFEAERTASAAAAADLQARPDSLAQFEEQKANLVAEMRFLRAENAKILEEAGARVATLQHRLTDLEAARAAERGGGTSASSGGSGVSVPRDCLEGLYPEGDLPRLLAHSRKAAADMEAYGKEAEALQQEMRGLEAERAGLLRDAQLQQEMEARYAMRGTLQVCWGWSDVGGMHGWMTISPGSGACMQPANTASPAAC